MKKKSVPTSNKELMRDSLYVALAAAICLGFLANTDTLLRDYPILSRAFFVAFVVVFGTWWLRMPSLKHVLAEMQAANKESAGPAEQPRGFLDGATMTDPQRPCESMNHESSHVHPKWGPPNTRLSIVASAVGVVLIGYGLHGLFMWPTTGYITVPALASLFASVIFLDLGFRGWRARCDAPPTRTNRTV